MNKLLALLSAILICTVMFMGCTSQPVQTTPTPGQTQGPESVSITPEPLNTISPVSSSFPAGITWRLFSYSDGKGGTVSIVGDQPVTALFRADGHVTGSSGCNQYTATYIATGSSIKITPEISTLMACSPPVMDQEMSYVTLLSRAATYSVSGDTMLFYDSTGNLVLAYKNPVSIPVATKSSQPPIIGSWNLATYNNGNNGLESVRAGSNISAVFTPDGQITGSSGCNQYSARYTLNGQNIGISLVSGPATACTADLMTQETQYQALLKRAYKYAINGDQLMIYNALGDTILIYNKGTATVTVAPSITPVSTPKTIVGSWALKSFSDGMGGTIPLIATAPVTAIFSSTGNLSGSSGCNQYVTSYSVTGLSISISPASTTKIVCAPDVMAQETAYLTLLQKSGRFTLYGDSMTISDSTGTALLNFKAIS
ncbi:MAG TPA: META domain-containing protein [Methanoregulaceae archaeon]|nr:META domain-containing protein [Methanoregulaceae archaeon]